MSSMRFRALGSFGVLSLAAGLMGCGPFGTVGTIGAGLDGALSPDVVVTGSVGAEAGGELTIEVEAAVLDDTRSHVSESTLLSVEAGDQLVVVDDAGGEFEPGQSYALFVNDRMGSDSLYLSYAHDLEADVPVAPFGAPTSGDLVITNRALVDVLDCLQRNGETRLDTLVRVVESDPTRRGLVDINSCL